VMYACIPVVLLLSRIKGDTFSKVSSPVYTEGLGHAASEMEVPFLASLLYESKKSEESDVVTFASYQA